MASQYVGFKNGIRGENVPKTVTLFFINPELLKKTRLTSFSFYFTFVLRENNQFNILAIFCML